MKVYSPSQTKLFLECEQKWYLSRKQHWESRSIEKKNLAALLGSSYGLAMAHYYKTDRKLTQEELVRLAQGHWDTEMTKMMVTRQLMDEDKAIDYYNRLPKMLAKTLSSDDIIPENWEVTAVEGLVSDSHKAYIDLGGLDHTGRDWFWDFKVKTYMKSSSIDFTFAQYDKDWQMLHYAWAYSQKLGRFVDTYYIGLMVVDPTTKFYSKQFTVTEQDVLKWLTSAVKVWSRMEQAEKDIEAGVDPLEAAPMSNEHYGRFGKCGYFSMCWEGANKDQFIQIERG